MAPKTAPKCELEQMFTEADTNGSGCLDLDELKKLLKKGNCNITDSQIKEVFTFFSEDGDQKITLIEFKNGLKALEEFADNLKNAFDECDTDKSGCLEKCELRKLLKECPCDFTDAEIEDILKNADASGDGKVCYEEFAQAFT